MVTKKGIFGANCHRFRKFHLGGTLGCWVFFVIAFERIHVSNRESCRSMVGELSSTHIRYRKRFENVGGPYYLHVCNRVTIGGNTHYHDAGNV